MSEENVPVKLDNSNLQQILIAVFVILITLGEVNLRLCEQNVTYFLDFQSLLRYIKGERALDALF